VAAFRGANQVKGPTLNSTAGAVLSLANAASRVMEASPTRQCKTCGESFALSAANFGHTGTGFKWGCRECERTRSKEWRSNNPDRQKDYLTRRQTREVSAGGIGITDLQLQLLRIKQNDQCAYCGHVLNGKGHADHVTPVFMGGPNDIDNILLACEICNGDKHQKTAADFIEWLRKKGGQVSSGIDCAKYDKYIRRDLVFHANSKKRFGNSGHGAVPTIDQVRSALPSLPPQQREIIRLHFAVDVTPISTLELIGHRLGITQGQVSLELGHAVKSLAHTIFHTKRQREPKAAPTIAKPVPPRITVTTPSTHEVVLASPPSNNKEKQESTHTHQKTIKPYQVSTFRRSVSKDVSAFAAEIGSDISTLVRLLKGKGFSNPNGSTFLSSSDKTDLRRLLTLASNEVDEARPAPIPMLGRNHANLNSEPFLTPGFDYDWPRAANVKPFAHQVETTRFLIQHPRVFCLNDMGTGKTLSLLWAFDYLRRKGEVTSMLVVCPLSTMRRTWADEIEQNFKGVLRYKVLHGGDGMERRTALADKAAIYIINPAGLRVRGMIDAFATRADIDLIVIDEIAQCARNAGTDTFRALLTLCNRQVPRKVIGMTGTPTPNALTDAWAQCKLVVPDKVPPYFNRFKEMVLRQINHFLWVPRIGALEAVEAAMSPQIRFVRDECIDLPTVMYETREVELGKAQKKLYEDMLARLHTEFDGKEIDAPNEMVKTMKLLQIACGAPYTVNGDAVFPPMPERLTVVHEIIESSAGKVIVFVPFRGAIGEVARFIGDQSISVGVIHGGVSAVKRDEIFKNFQQGAEPRVLVAQPQAMSHGLNLTAANTIIWFGPTTSADTYAQANARIMRPGQTRKQLIVNIESAEVEQRIFHRLRNKLKLQGVLLDLLAEKFGTRARPKGHAPSGYEVFPVPGASTQNEEEAH
jgi:superfamily II DNA or RNA helicase